MAEANSGEFSRLACQYWSKSALSALRRSSTGASFASLCPCAAGVMGSSSREATDRDRSRDGRTAGVLKGEVTFPSSVVHGPPAQRLRGPPSASPASQVSEPGQRARSTSQDQLVAQDPIQRRPADA